MKRLFFLVALAWMAASMGQPAAAGKKRSKKPPAPMNKKVKYDAYQGTDIAQIVYLTSRQEFRVGRPPYHADRFQVAEFALIAEHTRKYLRPDIKSEIKLAPGRDKPELMANKNFQKKFKTLVSSYKKLVQSFGKIKHPKVCNQAFAAYLAAMQDEIFLAEAITKRMFVSQQIRARELLRRDLKDHFRARDPNWFDRLCDAFEENADLAKFYGSFVDMLIEPALKKAKAEAEKAMAKVGVEYAVAVEEKEDGIIE
jgi:hypothetical protein